MRTGFLLFGGGILWLLIYTNPGSAAVGCLCKNYTKDAFCVQHIGACHSKAGNCIDTCTWTAPPAPREDKRKKPL